MAEYTRAVFDALEQGQADLAQAYASVQAEVSSLDARLRSSLPGWDGPAQRAYYTASARWDAAMANMTRVLAQFGAVTGTACSSYQSAEAANEALWS